MTNNNSSKKILPKNACNMLFQEDCNFIFQVAPHVTTDNPITYHIILTPLQRCAGNQKEK